MKTRHSSPKMSVLISVLGISGMVLGIALPAASDRIGRKPVMIVTSLLGMSSPLAAFITQGPWQF